MNIDNHKPQEELFIGFCTKNLLNKLFEDGEISALDKQKFFCAVVLRFILKHSLYVWSGKTSY